MPVAAADQEQLVVQLEARVNNFEKAFQRATRVSNDNWQKIERRGQQASGTLSRAFAQAFSSTALSTKAVNALTASLTAVGAALGVREVLAYTQAWVKAQNALKTAGVTNEQVAGTLNTLFAIAQRQGTALQPLVTLYGRVKQAADELGATDTQAARFTEGVALALRVGGTNSEQASGALLQLSQLLGSGTVRAQEFNSVLEGARPILQAVAAGMEETGGSVAKLRQLVDAGKVSSSQFFTAFLNGLPKLEDAASKAQDTVGQAFNRINNALTKYVGETDTALGISQRIAVGMSSLAKNFDTVATSVVLLGTLVGSSLIGRALTPLNATLLKSFMAAKTAVTGLSGLQVAIAGAALRAEAGSLALRGFAAASSLLGGPVGIALAGLAFAFSFAASRTQEAEEKAKRYAAALDRVRDAAKAAGDASKASAEQFNATETNRLSQQMQGDVAEIGRTVAEINHDLDAAIRRVNFQARGKANPVTDALKAVKAGLGDTAQSALATENKLFELANSNPRFQHLADQLKPLLERLAGARAAVEETRKALGKLATDTAADKVQAQLKLPSYDEASKLPQRDETLRAQATIGFIKEETRLYKLAEDQRRLQVATEEEYNKALAKGVELTKAQAREIAQTKINAEKMDQFARSMKAYAAETSQIGLEALLTGGTRINVKPTAPVKSATVAVSPTMPGSDYYSRLYQVESGGHANNPASTSSANGLGQFIESTWLDFLKRLHPDMLAAGKKAALDLRQNSALMDEATRWLTTNNAASLSKAGIQTSDANLYLAHFLGAGGAIAALTKSSDTLVRTIPELSKAIAANPAVFKNVATVGDLEAWAQRKMGTGQTATTGAPIKLPAVSVTTTPAETQAHLNAAEAAQKELEKLKLLNQAKLEGVPITDKVLRQIDEEATKRVQATAALERAKQARQGLIDLENQVGNFGVDEFEGLIEHTKTWTNVLQDATRMLLRMALQAALMGSGPLGQLFGLGGAGGKPGGLFGLIFGLFGGKADGGMVRGPGTSRSDSIPKMISDGEFITNAKATAQHRPLLEAINSGKLKGYANGGLVGAPSVPSVPRGSMGVAGANIVNAPTVNVKVDGSGGTPEQNNDLADKIGKTVQKQIEAAMTRTIRQQLRPGGILQNVARTNAA